MRAFLFVFLESRFSCRFPADFQKVKDAIMAAVCLVLFFPFNGMEGNHFAGKFNLRCS